MLLVLVFRIYYDFETLLPTILKQPLHTSPVPSTLYISVPRLFPFPLWKTALVFNLVAAAPLPPGETISLQLSLSSDAVLFLDKDGNVLPETFSMSVGENSPQSKVVVYPNLLPGNSEGLMPKIHVKVRQVKQYGETIIPLELPVQKHWLWRLIVDRLLELSIIGLIIQQLISFLERTEKEKKEKEELARRFLEENTPEKVGILQTIHRWAEKQKEWTDQPRKDLLDEKRKQWAENPENQKRYLLEIVSLEDAEIIRFLEEGKSFFKDDHSSGQSKKLSECLEYLIEVIKRSYPEDQWKKYAEGVLSLWDGFDASSREVVLKALSLLEPQMEKADTNILEKELFKTPNRRRLIPFLRSEKLREALKGYIPQISTTLASTPEPEDPPDVKCFLSEQHNLRRNPFGVSSTLLDPLIWNRWGSPEKEEWLLSPSPLVISLIHPDDGKIAAMYWSYLYMNNYQACERPVKGEFILCARLTPLEDFSNTPLLQMTQSIARAWLEILPVSPWVALDLPDPQRSQLGELLVWYMGDFHALRKYLENSQKEREKERNTLETFLYWMKKEIEKREIHSLSNETLMDWCALRPFGSQYTYLFLQDAAFPEQETLHARWWQLFSELLPKCLARKIVPKVFTPFQNSPLEGLRRTLLKWESAQLQNMLRDRFKFVGGEDFEQLFISFDVEQAREMFFNACRGSYGRMLRLGQALVYNHAERFPGEKYISLDELTAVIGE